ncbi:MAG: OFA family MFS transporter [Akkermansiaceae bacterium]|jgi:MFS family permease|tara:strand:+ start:4057 stop:5745 length:1689 start_codon:yes stop_codon:yes gene_type:complete
MPIPKILLKESIVAKPGFNRWLVPPASIAIHLCIGSVYAWSVFNTPLSKEIGVVGQAAGDWQFEHIVWIFSIAIVFLGLSAAIAGRWLEKVGPRCVGVTAALLWGGGFLVGFLGIKMHNLPLLYLGYGVLGGCGLGLGYVSPVSTLIRWFPDRRGLATGLAIMGFGGGAMIGAPLKRWLLQKFDKAPEFLGEADTLNMVTENGVRYVQTAAGKQEVIVASAADISQFGDSMSAGVYAVGTGNTGAATTFLVLGLLYLVVMLIAAFAYRVPAEDWKPKGWSPPEGNSKKSMISQNDVGISAAMKTPQFVLLWIVLCMNVTAGIGVIGVAKTMIGEIFGSQLSTEAKQGFFFANYVLMISVFNMVGRFFWASISDWIGRKPTYTIFFILGCGLYLSIPWAAAHAGASTMSTSFITFYAATMIIFTMYGGGFATVPAYLADMFGSKYVGAIHGRLLTAWSIAGVLGPVAIAKLREASISDAISNLASKMDKDKFAEKFGAPLEKIDELVAAKTVTVQKLMEIAPEGTIDPTPSLYNTTMYTMAGLLVIGFFANMMIKPVHSKHHL